MSEVITPATELLDEEGHSWAIIGPNCTLADIARWIVKNDYQDDVRYCIDLELNSKSA